MIYEYMKEEKKKGAMTTGRRKKGGKDRKQRLLTGQLPSTNQPDGEEL